MVADSHPDHPDGQRRVSGETPEAAPKSAPDPKFEVTASRQFPEWLAQQQVSLALTTYQAGKLFFVGLGPDGRLSLFERTFNRCMGLWGDGQTLWMSTLFQLWRFTNTLEPGQVAGGYDRLYVPRVGWTTGDIDIHDIAVDTDGNVFFVNTLFSCLATTDENHSFRPLWKPPFITKLAAEDRCHLNGLALEGGRPRWVTAVSRSDVAAGWRDRRVSGGCVIDVDSNEIVADGLSMPHSPRVHNGRLWVLDSGSGYFGTVDTDAGRFEPVTFCPGYLRGLCFTGDFAVVGMSLPRVQSFSGLPFDEQMSRRDAEPRCGLAVIDLTSGDMVHWLHIGGIVQELYDVVSLPGVRRPSALGFRTDEIRRFLSIGEESAAG